LQENALKNFKTVVAAAVGVLAFNLGAPSGQLGFAQAVAQAETVRPEVGKHLKDAAGFIKAGKYKEALAKLRDAEGVANRTPAENNAASTRKRWPSCVMRKAWPTARRPRTTRSRARASRPRWARAMPIPWSRPSTC